MRTTTPQQPQRRAGRADLPLPVGDAGWTATPFAGLGAGARTYRYRDVANTSARTDVAGYGALGLDVARAAGRAAPRVGLRLEARDYVSSFKGLRGELADRNARNDVALGAGLTVAF